MAFGPSPDSWVVRSDKDTHWTGAITDGAVSIEDLTPTDGSPTPQVVISRITLLSDQNLGWKVTLWKNDDTQPTTDLDTHGIVDFVSWDVADGLQIGGTGPWIYSISNMAIRWPMDDGLMNVGVIPVGANKLAGATGEVVVELSGPVI